MYSQVLKAECYVTCTWSYCTFSADCDISRRRCDISRRRCDISRRRCDIFRRLWRFPAMRHFPALQLSLSPLIIRFLMAFIHQLLIWYKNIILLETNVDDDILAAVLFMRIFVPFHALWRTHGCLYAHVVRSFEVSVP